MATNTYPIASLFNTLPFTNEQITLMDEFPASSFGTNGSSFNKNQSSLLNVAPFAKLLSDANYQRYGTGCYFGMAKGEWKSGFTLKVEPLGSTDSDGDYFDGIVSNAFSSEVTSGINTSITAAQRKVMQQIIINKLSSLLAYRSSDGIGFVYIDSSIYLGKDTEGVPTYAGSLLAEKNYDSFESIFYTQSSLEHKATRLGLNTLTAEQIATIKTSSDKLSNDFDIPMYDLMFALPVGSAKIVLYDSNGTAHSYIEFHQRYAYRSIAKSETEVFKGLVFEYVFGEPEAYLIESPAPSDRFALGWFESPRIRVRPSVTESYYSTPYQYYDPNYVWWDDGYQIYGGWVYSYDYGYSYVVGNEIYKENSAPVDDAIVFGAIDYSLLTVEAPENTPVTPTTLNLPYFEHIEVPNGNYTSLLPDAVCEFGVDDGFWEVGNTISIIDPTKAPKGGQYLKSDHGLYNNYSQYFRYTDAQAAIMQKVLMKRLRLEYDATTGYGKVYVTNIDLGLVYDFLKTGDVSQEEVELLTKAGIYQLSTQELDLFRQTLTGLDSTSISATGYISGSTGGSTQLNISTSPGALMLAFPVGDCRIAVYNSSGTMKGWLQYFQTTGIPKQIGIKMANLYVY